MNFSFILGWGIALIYVFNSSVLLYKAVFASLLIIAFPLH